MAKQFLCPFCFDSYDINDIQHYCSEGFRSKPGFREREPIRCKVPDCGCDGFARQRRCPSCNHYIPNTLIELPFLPFSIIGDQGSGKTTYITVMMKELEDASSDLNLLLEHLDDDTLRKREADQRQLYSYGTLFAPTPAGENPLPQIWRISNPARRFQNEIPSYNFTIYDGAGEDHRSISPESTTWRYIKHSQAIILLLDPLRLTNLRSGGAIDAEQASNSHTAADATSVIENTRNAADIVKRLAQYIRDTRGIKSGQALDIPVAVVMTKFDLVKNLFPRDALVMRNDTVFQNGKLNLAECQQIDAEIREWLTDARESAFVQAVQVNFSDVCFFGVSNFGSAPPNRSNTPTIMQPCRVLDPILWLFYKLGFIDG